MASAGGAAHAGTTAYIPCAAGQVHVIVWMIPLPYEPLGSSQRVPTLRVEYVIL